MTAADQRFEKLRTIFCQPRRVRALHPWLFRPEIPGKPSRAACCNQLATLAPGVKEQDLAESLTHSYGNRGQECAPEGYSDACGDQSRLGVHHGYQCGRNA
jgi:hypothetical protein